MEPIQKEALGKRDYAVAVDKSGSMSTTDCPGGKSRWAYGQEQVMNIARTCAQFDDDGIDVLVFGSSVKEHKGVNPEKVEQIFTENSPGGSTATGAMLKTAFDGYFARKAAGGAKPLTLVVFTDGKPDDEAEVKKVIIDAANKIDADEELAVTFIQVGKDEGAAKFLKELDDDLQAAGAKFDIVDTKNFEEMENISVEDILLEAVND